MCGRFVLASKPERLAEYFGARGDDGAEESVAPSWNVAPSANVLAVALDRGGERRLSVYRWGLVPSYAKDPSVGNRMINARAESLADRPAFRGALAKRRLVVLADGFYEWRKGPGGRRQPYYFTRADGAPIAFAGLYECWRDHAAPSDSPWLRTCTIITTGANADVAFAHDRMPVVLDEDLVEAWLDTSRADRDELRSLLLPASDGTLVSWPVGRAVGNVANDAPQLTEPIEVGDQPGAGPAAAS